MELTSLHINTMSVKRNDRITGLMNGNSHQPHGIEEDVWNVRVSKSFRSCERDAGLVPTIARKYSKTEDEENDYVQKRLEVLQEQSLIPIKEDLAEWISRLLEYWDVTEPLPRVKLKFKQNAASGSWFARDNVASFLNWCEAYGVPQECMFETEDLVSHKYEKSVVNCILELARIGYRFGIEPPSLIKIEEEIEEEEEEEEEIEEEVEVPLSTSLDGEVRKIAFKCKCHEHVKKIGAEKYRAFGKVINVRFLHNRHVLVRVGGGWDTLEHYLERHKPVEIFQHKNQMDITYLYIKSHYIHNGSITHDY
ncbi:hypothetical protein KUTeg_007848 [Tegillarca granosa]|uniref:GAR domain-containing protein n=1 Tax=Tegillarca granosa TaxID=220873 RepID=A0ABQ9FEE1_TEGGR|nr:hypothetical protein KUTeg_007848 [Tegillarca granosa]